SMDDHGRRTTFGVFRGQHIRDQPGQHCRAFLGAKGVCENKAARAITGWTSKFGGTGHLVSCLFSLTSFTFEIGHHCLDLSVSVIVAEILFYRANSILDL